MKKIFVVLLAGLSFALSAGVASAQYTPPETTTTTTAAPTTTTTIESVLGISTVPDETTTTTEATTTTTTIEDTVLGVVITTTPRGESPPPAVVLGVTETRGSLVRTGQEAAPYVLAGAALVGVGAIFVAASRKRRDAGLRAA